MASANKIPNNLLIGLGGTGGKILKEIKKRLYREHPDDKERRGMNPAIEFLYVDSTREMFDKADNSWRVLGRSVMFEENEFCDIKPQDGGVSRILEHIEEYPGLRHVVKNAHAVQNTLGEIGEAAGQKRRAGRIMFGASVTRFLGCVQNRYECLKNRTGQNRLHLHVFTGLAGGTGSGCIIDVVCQLKKEYPDAKLDVYAMVPEPEIPQNVDKGGRYYVNGYAALRELSALNAGVYLPSDIRTGEEHVALSTDPTKQFGLILYTNANESGMVFDSFKELPRIVAEAVYFSLMLPRTPDTEAFFKNLYCENGNDFQLEYSTKSKSKDKERARTKAVSTIGFKRISYPEHRIEEHISYTVSLSIIYQMLYNNFRGEGIGYVNEPQKKDYTEFLSSDANKAKWKLDDSHLMLNERILDTDKKFDPISTFWNNVVNDYSYDDAKNNDSEPLNFLETYCQEQFKGGFRLKKGVEEYYADKSSDDILRDQSTAIVEAIEHHLYTGWYEGNFSMTDLRGICGAILEEIKKRASSIEAEVEKLNEDLAIFENDRIATQDEFNQRGLFTAAVHFVTRAKSKIYAEHQETMQNIYVTRTNIVAKAFEQRLLGRLRGDFEFFMQQVGKFIAVLDESQKKIVNAITIRTRQQVAGDRGVDLAQVEVEVSEDDKVSLFEKLLLADRTTMDAMAGILRRGLVGERKFAHFDEVAQEIIPDTTIMELADVLLGEQVVTFHKNSDRFRSDPILGLNVLQELKKFIGNDDERLRDFAYNVIHKCSILLSQDMMEAGKCLKNNPDPKNVSGSMNESCLCICLPSCEGDDALKSFAARFESALRANIGSNMAGADVCISHDTQSKNEITIVQVRSLFPIRTIRHLPKMKQAYEKMVKSPNEAERRQAVILFHCEGDGSTLPQLEGEGEGPKGNDLRAYYFLAAAIGLIAEGENEREEHGWCFADKNRWGNTVMTLLSRDFCDIESSEELSAEVRERIVDGVDEYLKRDDLKVSERQEVTDRIVALMRDVVAKECSSVNSPKYRDYGAAAEVAINKIEKK